MRTEASSVSSATSEKDVYKTSSSLPTSKHTDNSSCSELSEDDTPLLQRFVSSKRAFSPCKIPSKEPKPKKTGFVIPRKKRQKKELLQDHDFNSREGKELVRNVQQSFRNPALGAIFKFEKLQFVHNEKLFKEFHAKKQAMRSDGRSSKELEDKYAYFFCSNTFEVKKVCSEGLTTGAVTLTSLGDPKMGVYLSRHAELITRLSPSENDSGCIVVFKVLKGRVKTVAERNTRSKVLLEPTPNFDCHVSKSYQSLAPTALHSQAFLSSQIYFYEFAEEGDELHMARPRQCLPFAVISFIISSSSDPQVPLEIVPVQRKDICDAQKDNTILLPEGTDQTSVLEEVSDESGADDVHVMWCGTMMNKEKPLSDVRLICYSRTRPKLPFELGESIDIKAKIPFEKLKPLLNIPMFSKGLPRISKECEVISESGHFFHCEFQPVDNSNLFKLEKLTSYFIKRRWAGVIDFGGKAIYLIPTSDLTHDLGITDARSPTVLHALFSANPQTKTPEKEDIRRHVMCDKGEAEKCVINQIQERFSREIKVTEDEGKSNEKEDVYNMSFVTDASLKGQRTSATTAAEIEKLWYAEHSGRSCITVEEGGRRKPQKEMLSWLSSNHELREKDTSYNLGYSPGERSGSHPKLAHSSSWPQRVDRTMHCPVQRMLSDVHSKNQELDPQLLFTSQSELTSIGYDVRERSGYVSVLPMETSFVQETEKGLLRNDKQQLRNVSESGQSYSSLSQAQGNEFSFKENQVFYDKSFKENSISPISVELSRQHGKNSVSKIHEKESLSENSEVGQKSISVLRVEHGRDDHGSKDSQHEHSRSKGEDYVTSNTAESQFTTSSCSPAVDHLLKNLRAIDQITEEEKPENVDLLNEQGCTSKKRFSSKFGKDKKAKKAHEDLPKYKGNKSNAKSITNSKGNEKGRELLLHNKCSDGKLNRDEFISAADTDKTKEDLHDYELSSSGIKTSVQNTTSHLPISLSAVSSTQPSSFSLSPSANNSFTKSSSSNLPKITDILSNASVISSPKITNILSSCSPSNEVGSVRKSSFASSTVSSSSTLDVVNALPTSCIVSPTSDFSLSPVKSVSSNCSSLFTDNSYGAAQVRNNSVNSQSKSSVSLSATMQHKVKIVSSDPTSPEIALSNSTLRSSTSSSFAPLSNHRVSDSTCSSRASSTNAITVVSRRGKYSSQVLPDTIRSANKELEQPPLPPPLPPTISPPPPPPDSNASVSYANPPPINRQINPPPSCTLPTPSTLDPRDKVMFGNAVIVQQNPWRGETVYEQMLRPSPLQLPQQPPSDMLNQGYVYSSTGVAVPNRHQTFGYVRQFSESHCVPPNIFPSVVRTPYGSLQNQRYPDYFFGSPGFFQSRQLENFQPYSQGVSEGREYHSPSNSAPATPYSSYFESPRVNYSVDFNALPSVYQQQSTNADITSSVLPSCQSSGDNISNNFSYDGSSKHNTNTHLDQISSSAKTKSSDAVKEIFDILKRNRTPGGAAETPDVEGYREENDEYSQAKENCHVNVEGRQDRSYRHPHNNREILADKENKSNQEEMLEIDLKPSSSDDMQVLNNNTSQLTKELDLPSEKDDRVEEKVIDNGRFESDSSKGSMGDKEKDPKITKAVKPVVPKDSSRSSPAMHCGLDVVNNLLGSESEENFTETESPCRADKLRGRSDESPSVTAVMSDEVTETDGQPVPQDRHGMRDSISSQTEKTVMVLNNSKQEASLDGLKLEGKKNEKESEASVKDQHDSNSSTFETVAKRVQRVPDVVKFAADSSVSDDTLLDTTEDKHEEKKSHTEIQGCTEPSLQVKRKIKVVKKREVCGTPKYDQERQRIKRIVEEHNPASKRIGEKRRRDEVSSHSCTESVAQRSSSSSDGDSVCVQMDSPTAKKPRQVHARPYESLKITIVQDVVKAKREDDVKKHSTQDTHVSEVAELDSKNEKRYEDDALPCTDDNHTYTGKNYYESPLSPEAEVLEAPQTDLMAYERDELKSRSVPEHFLVPDSSDLRYNLTADDRSLHEGYDSFGHLLGETDQAIDAAPLVEQITTTPADFFGQTTTSEERDSMIGDLRERRPTEEDLENSRLMGRQSSPLSDLCRNNSDSYSRPHYSRAEGSIDDRHRSSRENSHQRGHYDKRSGRTTSEYRSKHSSSYLRDRERRSFSPSTKKRKRPPEGEITSQGSGDATGESTGSDKSDLHHKDRTYLESNVENSFVHVDIRKNDKCNIYKKIRNIFNRYSSNTPICIKKNELNGEEQQLSEISIVSCDHNINSVIKTVYLADKEKKSQNSNYLGNEMNDRSFEYNIDSCHGDINVCSTEDNGHNIVTLADLSKQPIRETDTNFVNREKTVERSDKQELEKVNNLLDNEIKQEYVPICLAASGNETETESVNMEIGSPVEALGNETESESVAMELETDEEKDEQEDCHLRRESCVNVPRPFTSNLEHTNNFQEYGTGVSLQNAYLNQNWSHQFHPMPSPFMAVHGIQSSFPLDPHCCQPLEMNMLRPVAELGRVNVVGNAEVPYFNCQYGLPQIMTKEVWCDSFLQNSTGYGVPIQGAQNYWYNDRATPNMNALEATHVRKELKTPVTTKPENSLITQPQLYNSAESRESADTGEANPYLTSRPGAPTTSQPEQLKTSRPEQVWIAELNSEEVVTTDSELPNAGELESLLTTKPESLGTTNAQSLAINRAQLSVITKAQLFGATKAEPTAATKAQPTDPAKAQPPEATKTQPPEPANTQPLESSKAQHLKPEKSQPPGRAKAQPSEPAKVQPLKNAKPQPLEPAKAQPLKNAKLQLSAPAKAQPLKPAKSQPSGLPKVQLSESAKAQPLKPAKSQPSGPAKAQTSEPAKAQPLKKAKLQLSAPAKAQPLKPAKSQPSGLPKAQPSEPAKEQTSELAKAKPLKNAKSQPSGLVKVQPSEPAKALPLKHAESQPSGLAKVQPSEPAKVQPLKPAKSQPSGVAKAQPLKPAKAQPLELIKEQPSESGKAQQSMPAKVQLPESAKVQAMEPFKAEPPDSARLQPHSMKAQPLEPARAHSMKAQPLEPARAHSMKAQPLEPARAHSMKAQPLEPARAHSMKAQPLEPARAHSMKAQSLEPSRVQPPAATKEQQPEATKIQPLEATKEQQPEATKEQQPEATKEQQPEATKEQQPEATKIHPLKATKEQQPEATKEQQPEATKEQQPEATKIHPLKATKEQQPAATKEQQPEATKTQPLETTKAQPSEVTKVLLPGTAVTHSLKTIAQQSPGATKSLAPETSKSQLPGRLEPTNISRGIVEVEMLSKLKEVEQITKAKKVTTENSSERDCTTHSLALCREKQKYDDSVMLVDDSQRISGNNGTYDGNRDSIPTSAAPLEIKNNINENVQKPKIVTNSTEDNTICNDSLGDRTPCKETGIFICETKKPASNEMSLDSSTFTNGYQKLQGINEMNTTSTDSKEEHHDNPNRGNVMNESCSDTAARNSIFTSLESLKSSLGAFTAFDKIANAVILSTVTSLENVLRKATSTYGDTQNDVLGGPQTKHAINKAYDYSSDGNVRKIVEGCNMIDDPNQVVGFCRGDGLMKNRSSNSRCQGAYNGLTQNKIEHQLEKKKMMHSSKKGFQFAVYNPDGDPECEAVKNYLLRAGGFFIDTSITDDLPNIEELRVFIRRKHIPSLHRVGNLYRLKMLQSVKFSLFKSLSDVTEKRRAYETIFPVGGVVIPDDTVLGNSSPVEVAALLLFMKELSSVQQRFLWVMHISRRAYKKIVPVRPATLEGSQTMDLLRSYRMDGFVHLLSKDYVAEKVAPAQRYLDTVLKQQIELMKQYRHFVLLADHRERKQEEWFVARGIGVFTIREFLDAFAGEREAEKFLGMAREELKKEALDERSVSRKVLSQGSVSDDGDKQEDRHSRDNGGTEFQKLLPCNKKKGEHVPEHRKLERERVAEHKRILEKENGFEKHKRKLECQQVPDHNREGLSAEPVTSCNSDRAKRHRSHISTAKTNMKETRLEILSSLKNRRDALVNKSCVNQGRAVVLKQPHCENSMTTTAPLQDMTDSCMRWP